jgi:hypothetical protein
VPGSLIFAKSGYTAGMKLLFLACAAAALLLAGCGDKSSSSAVSTNAASDGGNPLNAPGDYLRGLANGQQSAIKGVDTASLNRAIQMYGVDHGGNPKDLNELVTGHYIPKIPDAPYGMKLVYDADAGTVSVVKQ